MADANVYYRAYLLEELRSYPGFPTDLFGPEITVCYLRDDLTVVADPLGGDGPVWRSGTDAWATFCRTRLDFSVPDDIRTGPDRQPVSGSGSAPL